MSFLPKQGIRDKLKFETVGVPSEYFARYVSQKYDQHSPLVRRLRKETNPFRWEDLKYDKERQPRAHQVMTESWDFGLRSGWTIPVLVSGKLEGWVSVSASEPVEANTSFKELHVMALWAHRHATFRAGSSDHIKPLSPREREVLTRIATGMTTDQIADAYALSKRTVEYHVTNSMHKLGAATRTQAVVEAIKTRQIIP